MLTFFPLLLVLHTATAASGEIGESVDPSSVHAAVELLSRYPLGQVPVEPSTMGAIHTLADEGTRAEVGVLRSLAEHERAEVRSAAVDAIDKVRGRQRVSQREAYAEGLPTDEQLERASVPWQRLGMELTSAHAAAYATWVLGEHRTDGAGPRVGDARRLIATGQPRKALGALSQDVPTTGDLVLVATAREDAGDVRGALQAHTVLALAGESASEDVLTSYGVELEKLYLGLLVMERAGPVGDQEVRLLDALVRLGGLPAAEVLAERMFTAGGSERASAADALIRMLDRGDLDGALRERIRQALVKAVEEGPAPVRDIAAAGL
ncbi:MAG: hypothetical protein EP330_05285 [Deltaproteobacteria bacterium]|nr:MAG: hypothetical protein EP330_05285 [Deltaproteobacteria bacterium]